MSYIGGAIRGPSSISIDWTVKYDQRYLNFVKRVGVVINEQVIHDLVVSALSDAWKEARANANTFRDTGFLMDNIYVYMVSQTEGILAATADYSAAQEFGFRNRRGTFVQGHHYMTGPAATAKKRIQEKLTLLQKAFVSGIKPDFKATGGVSVKSGFPQSAKKPSRTGSTRQATVMKRARYADTGVFHVGRKRVQLRTKYRKAPRQLIGGNQ